MTRRIAVSLHDVSPRHAGTIERILPLLEAAGVPPVPLLVVPDFHGGWPLDAHPAFVERLHAWKEAGHELVLHGYWHLEQRSDALRGGAGDAFKRGFLTGGEGEFLALEPHEAARRIDDGLAMWQRAGLPGRPVGFVPPAWLHNASLDAVLWARGFEWTESHSGYRFRDGGPVRDPVISWASRDFVRRAGSRVVCPLLERLWRRRPSLRIALHPHDFDWPALERSIHGVLTAAARNGTWVRPMDLRPAR